MSEHAIPQDIESERALLATICAPGADNLAAEIIPDMSPEDFMHPIHKAIHRALVVLLKTQTEISPFTLRDAILANGDIDKVGGYSGVIEVLEGQEVNNPWHLVEIIKKHTKRRSLIRLGAAIIRTASEESDPEPILESACSDLAKMAHSRGEAGPVAIGTMTDAVVSQIIAETSGSAHFGARTGFYRFDGITRGFKPGELIILAARPGVGKSTLALNWARGVAQRSCVPVFSLEMSGEEITRKLLTDMSGMSLRDLQPEQFPRLAQAKYDLDTLPLMIDDRSGINVRQIRSKVERIQARQKVGLVVIDYLQLLTSVDKNSKQNETNRIGEISRELKIMAKDCKVPVLVLSQLNREVEKRQNGKPQLSDLRDSGCIEQDADIVVFIHRKIVPGLSPELQDKTGELHIAKHRNGPCGSVPVLWDGELSRYSEQDRDTGSRFEPEYQVGRQTEMELGEAI